MSQVEASKVIANVAVGPDGDEAVAAKVVCYLVLRPGAAGEDLTRTGSVFSNVVRKP